MSAKIVYKDYNQNESLLFPPTLGELVPERENLFRRTIRCGS